MPRAKRLSDPMAPDFWIQIGDRSVMTVVKLGVGLTIGSSQILDWLEPYYGKVRSVGCRIESDRIIELWRLPK